MRARYAYTLTIAILAGIVVAFVFDENRTVSVLSFSLRYAVPLILAAMVGIICERSGHQHRHRGSDADGCVRRLLRSRPYRT